MTSSTLVSSVVLARYAGALVDLAEKAKSVDKVKKDLADIDAMIGVSEDLARAITSPLLSRAEQAQIIADLSKKAKFDKLTQNFLGVLINNRRLNALSGVIKAFNAQVSARAGEVSVRVETAVKMSAAQEKSFQKKIEDALGRGVSMTSEVVPEIIGGTIVTIGSYMVDDSVRRKLERLNVALKSRSNQNAVQNLKEVV